jgi:phosphoadenosine phosphosulfate reductase
MTGLGHPSFATPDAHYAELEIADPKHILEWAASTIERLAVATSFQSSGLVILHLLRDIRPDLPVLFLETGFHFDETLRFKEEVVEMFDLKLVELRGAHGTREGQEARYGPALYERDAELCCHINKVEPLQEALEEYDAWISGIRRDQSPIRAATPIVEAQLLPSGNEVLKIHPLAHWSRGDVEDYVRAHDIPTHPLFEKGYQSIGCWPCTRAVVPAEHEREGRWDGLTKTECGIHTFGSERQRRNEAEM